MMQWFAVPNAPLAWQRRDDADGWMFGLQRKNCRGRNDFRRDITRVPTIFRRIESAMKDRTVTSNSAYARKTKARYADEGRAPSYVQRMRSWHRSCRARERREKNAAPQHSLDRTKPSEMGRRPPSTRTRTHMYRSNPERSCRCARRFPSARAPRSTPARPRHDRRSA